MRTVTRNLVVAVLAVVAVLLALGALPGYLGSGDPYYVEATTAEGDGAAVVADNLSERRFPYAFEALGSLEAGEEPARSEAYYEGPVGFKESFTHTPFDEFGEFESRNRDAVERDADSPVGDVAYLEYDGQRYRLEIVRGTE
ncbi:hypothetical protein HWV07_10040 [Natronomonas salina]|uniref:hypothetical protein n=1 Tax=Natronomonas salina TaxID=1710540 RepID=UPI0015B72D7D|nr:hypothetical protein [Natronomonas salina]QLD89350.1 hypothetical protein HWV07_10040 [Natronomonas salina]